MGHTNKSNEKRDQWNGMPSAFSRGFSLLCTLSLSFSLSRLDVPTLKVRILPLWSVYEFVRILHCRQNSGELFVHALNISLFLYTSQSLIKCVHGSINWMESVHVRVWDSRLNLYNLRVCGNACYNISKHEQLRLIQSRAMAII